MTIFGKTNFAGVTFDFVALTERERISRFGHVKTSIGAFSRPLNFSTMPRKCCSCNSSGHCKNCSCKRKNFLCVKWAPCQHARCCNHNLPGEPMSASQPIPETKSILHSKNGNPFFVSGASNSEYSSFFHLLPVRHCRLPVQRAGKHKRPYLANLQVKFPEIGLRRTHRHAHTRIPSRPLNHHASTLFDGVKWMAPVLPTL